jgi:serpin B
MKEAKGLAIAINTFASDLYTQLAKDDKGTLLFSPFSISTALAMTSAGAKVQTLDEMQKVLHLPTNPHSGFHELLTHLNATGLDKDRGYELTAANDLWAMKDYPWRKQFLHLTQKHYGAGVMETDFGMPEVARQRINEWVEKETRERIKDLIPAGAIDTLTRMVLTNAIYFKGDWASTFDEKRTRNASFTRIDGTKAEVPLMAQTGEFGYGEFTASFDRKPNRVQVLDLPYVGNELSMRVYLSADIRVVEKLDLGMKAAFGKADFSGMYHYHGSRPRASSRSRRCSCRR